MKDFVKFILGLVIGLIIALIVDSIDDRLSNRKGMTFFETPGSNLSIRTLKVFQVIDENYALAHELEVNLFSSQWFTEGLLVLITNDDGEYYYDGQIIDILAGKCLRQVGVYKYVDKSDEIKTVPIVKLMNEE